MLANRISHWLGVTGPSYAVDTACSSSIFAMEHAFRAIRNGRCDSAIVGASNLCLHPYVSLQFYRLGKYRILVISRCIFVNIYGKERQHEHFKTMLAIHSLPLWDQRSKGANYV